MGWVARILGALAWLVLLPAAFGSVAAPPAGVDLAGQGLGHALLVLVVIPLGGLLGVLALLASLSARCPRDWATLLLARVPLPLSILLLAFSLAR